MFKFHLMVMSCCVLSCSIHAHTDPASVQVEESSLELSTYSMQQVEPLLPLLEEWVQREFRQYPYLWLPAQGQYCLSNQMLVTEKDALVTLVKKGEHVVGVAAGVAMDTVLVKEYLGPSVSEKIKEQGLDPSQMIYMCYFLTAPEYRNDEEIVKTIYNQYIDFAHKIGKSQICYFEDPGKFDHPLKPDTLMPIEPWGHVIHGFSSMNFEESLSWPTIQSDGSVCDQAHVAEFFYKNI